MKIEENILQWLLDSDPSIRWQVMQNLADYSNNEILSERKKISSEGWGAKIFSLQDSDGKWACSLYSRKWISTTYTLLLLKNFGLLPGNKQAIQTCNILIDEGFYEDGGINYFSSLMHSETCVTGMVLSLLSYFKYEDDRLDKLVGHLVKQQMKDGGWNCRSYNGDTHSSFHTTLSVLEGLREYQKNFNQKKNDVSKSIDKGIEFLLVHKLFRSHRTGKIVDEKMTRFSFPTRWRYDVLRTLDFLQEYNAPKDKRINDAIELVLKRRDKDGRWKLQNRHAGKTFFEMEVVGRPSKWNTMRALRVLKWWTNK